MNQINLGEKAGIDTKQVAFWDISNEDATVVILRSGFRRVLWGDAKAAFGEWASLIEQRAIREVASPSVEQLTAMAYKQGVRAGREVTPSCQTCIHHDWKIGPCQSPMGADAFPECYKERRQSRPPCGPCIDYNAETNWCDRADMSKHLPECFRERDEEKKARPLCKTCACYDAESGRCAEFAGNHYPTCWVERKEDEMTHEDAVAKGAKILAELDDGSWLSCNILYASHANSTIQIQGAVLRESARSSQSATSIMCGPEGV